ncbi:YkgJ family cysteine cluster protein [Microvirga flavescens]|uniref:YkgJ family cysteine cluster protein n=1 Tax=Microvirga flavescens TaxID=2249811 RepID=UPI000DD55EBC|nr:YkgJ family cysteine cluster protein [Microvirga flavescens]
MAQRETTSTKPRVHYDCTQCPAFCCSIYERVTVTPADIKRLAKHFGVPVEEAREKYTKQWEDERILRRVKDTIFEETCMFLDQKTRGCTIYHGRPGVCRTYPARSRCAYFDVLRFEQKQQGDKSVMPVVKIIFREDVG